MGDWKDFYQRPAQWASDGHGPARVCPTKVYGASHTFGMKFSQLANSQGCLRIAVRELNDSTQNILGKRPFNIKVLLAKRPPFETLTWFPEIEFRFTEDISPEFALLEPETLYFLGARASAGIRSDEAVQFFLCAVWEPMWKEAKGA